MEVGYPKSEIETPALCLDIRVYERNVARMVDFIVKKHGVAWRPHMKGQKAPELALRAVAAGAIGVTCATVYEAEAMAAAGVKSILIAHEVTGARKCDRLVRIPGVIAATDSLAHAKQMSDAAVRAGTTLSVLIELNVGMNRCGVEPGEPTVALAKAVAAMPGLKLVGLMGWEGHILKHEGDEKMKAAESSLGELIASAEACRAAGLPIEIVSSAGSGTFLFSCNIKGITEVQAGGGVFSDLSYEKWGLNEHEFALTVASRVVSRPPTRIITDAGFKSMSAYHAPPKAIGVEGIKSLVLSAEHGIIELEAPSETPHVGDILEFIPGYTDSTLCLHDAITVIRDGVVEAIWRIPGRSGNR